MGPPAPHSRAAGRGAREGAALAQCPELLLSSKPRLEPKPTVLLECAHRWCVCAHRSPEQNTQGQWQGLLKSSAVTGSHRCSTVVSGAAPQSLPPNHCPARMANIPRGESPCFTGCWPSSYGLALWCGWCFTSGLSGPVMKGWCPRAQGPSNRQSSNAGRESW